MQNTKNNYCKEKAAKYYLKNKEELKKSQKIGRKIYQKKEGKDKFKKYQNKKYQQLIQCKNELLLIKQKNRSNKFYFAKYKNELKAW